MGFAESVKWRVLKDGKSVSVVEDGYLGEFAVGTRLAICARVDDNWIVPIIVDGPKSITEKRALNQNELEERGLKIIEGQQRYELKVPIKWSNGYKCAHTEYPNNNLRFLECGEMGEVTVWEVAIVSQRGKFFHTVEKSFSGRFWWVDDSKKSMTCLRNIAETEWMQLAEFVAEKFVPYEADELDVRTNYKSEEQQSGNLQPNTGRVIWWSLAQQYGAIETPEGAARVHWTKVVPRQRLAQLKAGELVRYERLQSPNLTKARTTSFKWEAVGVQPIE